MTSGGRGEGGLYFDDFDFVYDVTKQGVWAVAR